MFNAESNVSKHLEINVNKNEPQIGGKYTTGKQPEFRKSNQIKDGIECTYHKLYIPWILEGMHEISI